MLSDALVRSALNVPSSLVCLGSLTYTELSRTGQYPTEERAHESCSTAIVTTLAEDELVQQQPSPNPHCTFRRREPYRRQPAQAEHGACNVQRAGGTSRGVERRKIVTD